MKKSKKLLSVLLAILMILSSMSVMASAARTEYKTVANLESLDAYSPYGAVTRLSTEERLSIVCDYLDNILEEANINMGQIINTMGLTLTIDLTSVNAICETLDQVKTLKSNGLVKLVQWMLGIINDLNVNSWEYDVDRDNGGSNNYAETHKAVVNNLLHVLSDNASLIANIVRTGEVDLGVASSAVSGLDLSIVKDIPGLIKGLIFPLFERKDDNTAQINTLMNTAGDGGLQTVLNSFVQGLFTKPQSTTTYKEDANGNCVSNHTLPTSEGTRYYYVKSADGNSYTCYYYDTSANKYMPEDEVFKKTLEEDGTYTYRKLNGDALKYYENESYWLPSVTAAIAAGNFSVDLNTNSAASLLYNFIPYVFAEMAPVVLNGSVKKILGEWFGATYTYVGEVGSAEVTALPDASNAFFTQAQGDYLWEWSDYAVINGNHYYRFEDSIYAADLSNINPYFNIINWDYEITDDFLNEFIPGADGNTASEAGYTTILQALNKFLVKVANTVLDTELVAEMNLVNGDNSNLVANVKKAAQTVVAVSPESIFGSNYNDSDKYYSLMMSTNDQEVLVGIACTLVELLMPQMILPTADKLSGQSVGAILAAVVSEIATQLVPGYNYDALIYSNYNTKTLLSGKDNSYWLDVCLTIGTDIGMKYLSSLADLGKDTEVGYNFADSKTYTLAAFEANTRAWEDTVDWVIDWALSDDYEWTWKMEKLVDTTGLTIDLTTAQDPWVKLGQIFKSVLPINDVFNIDTSDSSWLETLLRDDFVLALLDLDVTKIVGGATATGILNIPTTSVLRQTNLFTQVTTVVRNLLNAILNKVASGDLFSATVFTNFDAVLNQTNICDLVQLILQKLYVANGNGLLDVLLPFANFFIGWTTDAQKYKDPSLIMDDTCTTDSSTATTTLTVRNDSAGMLLKHRTSSVLDTDYILVVEGISGDYTTSASFPISILPYAKTEISLSRPYTEDEVANVVVSYHLEKNGTIIGGTQQKSIYQLITNKTQDIVGSYSDNNTQKWGAWTLVNYNGSATTGAVVTSPSQLAGTISRMTVTWSNQRDTACTFTASSYADYDSTYIVDSGAAASILNTQLGASGSDTASVTVSPARLNPDVDVNTLASGTSFALGSVSSSLYGTYAGQKKTGSLTCNFDTLYYANMQELISLVSSTRDSGRKAENYTAESWATYDAALRDAIKFVDSPKMKATFSSTYTDANIAAQTEALEAATKGLVEVAATDIDLSTLETALATAEPGGDVPEINYQDYVLYEYFEYQDERTETRNILKAYTQPAAPENRIDGSSLTEAEIDALIAAETNTLKANAISATVIEPTAEETAAYNEAVANWQTPGYTQLEVDNQALMLTYYKQFLEPVTVNKQFLQREIAYAAAQNYVETDYSVDSWANYQAALANANAVNANANALQSQVFDAKYNLMKAENELLLAAKSAKDTGAYADLEALIAKAEDIFTNPDNYTVVAGVAEADAYKELIVALGYEYEGGNLYSHSALDYVAYDRETTTNNLNKIATAEDTLAAAIANFESLAGDPVLSGVTSGVVDEARGYVYGVPAGAAVADYFSVENGTFTVSGNGTGATLTVYNTSGAEVAVYTLVIFGDVNGDGEVTASDYGSVKNVVLGATLEGVFAFAADVTGDGEIATADYAAIKNCVSGADLTVNPYA